METIKIINNNDFTLSIQIQNLIKEGVVNIGGIDEVIVGEVFEDEFTGYNMLSIYYESTDNGETIEEFLFNVNLDLISIQ
jgi:hypothetical protein